MHRIAFVVGDCSDNHFIIISIIIIIIIIITASAAASAMRLGRRRHSSHATGNRGMMIFSGFRLPPKKGVQNYKNSY
jgi:hypothetical protein